MKKTLYIFIIVITFLSCSKTNSIEDTFVTGQNEYWTYYSQGQSGYMYFKFHKDKTYDKYERDLSLFNNDGDLISGNRNWSVSKDSIFTWGAHKYDLISCNEKAIVIMYFEKNGIPGYIFFIKEKVGEKRKGDYYYEQKRLKNVEKYKSAW